MTEVHRLGATLLSAGDGDSGIHRDLNIIFIHGLRGHPRGTWTSRQCTSTTSRNEDTDARIEKPKNIMSVFSRNKSKNERNNQGQTSTSIPADVFWPEDYLVPDLPQARIWTYGYNADVIGGLFQVNNKNSVSQHGGDLAIKLDREIDNEDPILFVVHSLGGIIIKDALHKSVTICKRTRLIVFLGTPHRGSSYAGWGEIASNLASLGLQDSNRRLVQTLEVNGEVLDIIHDEFKNTLSKYPIKVHSFQEAKGVFGMKGLDSKVVNSFSSKLDLAREQETVETIDANHMEMARCSSRDDARYRQICGVLKHFVRTEVSNAQFVGNPGKQVDNSFNVPHDSQHRICLQDLRTTDPREDKKRIEQTKGGLLKDSYRWILEHSDFQQWRDDKQRPLLWIKGDPGKGKTMLVCGIIDEVSRRKDAAGLLSYFFCQATDTRLNNATAVLRGLVYLLIDQQRSLISHVQKKYDQGAKTPFEGVNAWAALSMVFEDILKDMKSQSSTYLIVDALDECDTELPQLLNLITQSASRFPWVKWVVSSRNKPDIEARLRLDQTEMRLSLELNETHVSRAIKIFIGFRVSRLPLLTNDTGLQEIVREKIYAKATGTFLWVALVLGELKLVESWDVLKVLDEMPPGLVPLYHRMIQQIDQLERKDPEFCRYVLSTMILAYRPLLLVELGALSGLPERISKSPDYVARVVRQCGSFLTIRGGTVFFIHQSAKDYLSEETYDMFFPAGSKAYHYTIFSRSLQVLSKILRRDVYKLRAPGISIDQVKQPNSDPLAAVRYSCLYWVDHLLDCQAREETIKDLKDSGLVYMFLRQYFLYWLEALSLLRSMSEGVVMIKKLEDLLVDGSTELQAFIHDARRFAVSNRSIIEQAPLQTYCSALVFAPEKSIVRETFESCIPSWIQRKPRVETSWNAMLQTLEGHTQYISSVAFSPDSKQIVSGSLDKTVRRWDAATGQLLLPALEGHTQYISSVAFSSDSKQIISGSWDKTVRRWDAATGQLLLALEGHIESVTSVAFSPDSKQIVSGSWDKTVRRWDAATGQQLLPVLEGHTQDVSSVASSPDGKHFPTLHVSDHWLVEGSTPLLWLPFSYRPTCEAVRGMVVALGHASGRLSVLQIQQGLKYIT